MNPFQQGSQWRKWDLHFHTPSSYDYKNKSISNQDIVSKWKKEGLYVVAITDHHIIDIERLSGLRELAEEVGITVLPGIECCGDARGRERCVEWQVGLWRTQYAKEKTKYE